MALFETSLSLSRPVEVVFDFFVQPALFIATAPPELSLQLLEAPERLSLGARVQVSGRRWGIPHRATTEVTAFVPGELLMEWQTEGTFRRWEMTRSFEGVDQSTLIRTHIYFEPPGRLLGLTVTEARVRRDLEWVFQYQGERLRERWS